MGKKDRRRKKEKNANKSKTSKSTKEQRRDKNRGRGAGPKLDGTTRIAGLGDFYDFTRGKRSCVSTWDSLSKQEQYDLINISKDDIKRAIEMEVGNSIKMVKTPDEEELRIYQAAFIQAMAPIYMVEDDRGKVELPPDPSVNNIFIFGAFADRLVLWDTCRTASYTLFYMLLFLIFYMTHIAVSVVLIPCLIYISISDLNECVMFRKWYVRKCNDLCIHKFSSNYPVSWKVEANINSIVATFVIMLKFQYGIYYTMSFCCLQTFAPFGLLLLSSSDPKSFKTLRIVFAIVNHGILALYSWNETITLIFTVYIFFPTLSLIGFRLYFGVVGVVISYFLRFMGMIIPNKWSNSFLKWIEKENSYNVYYAISFLQLTLILLYRQIWSWSYLPFGTLCRSFLLMISLNSVPWPILLSFGLAHFSIAATYVHSYFEKYIVLYFKLNTRVSKIILLVEKKINPYLVWISKTFSIKNRF